MRKRIVIGNWKMNKTPKEAIELCRLLKDKVNVSDVDVVFCPPAIDLVPVAMELEGTNIKLGAQNMYHAEKGAFTGEISPLMLRDVGCEYVILGHSERRTYFGETDRGVNRKVISALEHNLAPIICVGDNNRQRQQGLAMDVISIQVKDALLSLDSEQVKKIIIAYEPLWAIGTGLSATKEHAQEVCGKIRDIVKDLYDIETAQTMRIQYGGSVNGDNASDFFSCEDIDGGLIGGASLKEEFEKIVKCS